VNKLVVPKILYPKKRVQGNGYKNLYLKTCTQKIGYRKTGTSLPNALSVSKNQQFWGENYQEDLSFY